MKEDYECPQIPNKIFKIAHFELVKVNNNCKLEETSCYYEK